MLFFVLFPSFQAGKQSQDEENDFRLFRLKSFMFHLFSFYSTSTPWCLHGGAIDGLRWFKIYGVFWNRLAFQNYSQLSLSFFSLKSSKSVWSDLPDNQNYAITGPVLSTLTSSGSKMAHTVIFLKKRKVGDEGESSFTVIRTRAAEKTDCGSARRAHPLIRKDKDPHLTYRAVTWSVI